MPATTLDLLTKATETTTAEALSRDLGLSDTAIAMAKHRKRLSPALAGRLAERLGLDPEPWIALAAIEATKRDRYVDGLRRRIVANLRI